MTAVGSSVVPGPREGINPKVVKTPIAAKWFMISTTLYPIHKTHNPHRVAVNLQHNYHFIIYRKRRRGALNGAVISFFRVSLAMIEQGNIRTTLVARNCHIGHIVQGINLCYNTLCKDMILNIPEVVMVVFWHLSHIAWCGAHGVYFALTAMRSAS